MRIGYHLSSEEFAPAELLEQAAEAFFLADLPGPARDMGLAEPVRAVRRKVLAALPPGCARLNNGPGSGSIWTRRAGSPTPIRRRS